MSVPSQITTLTQDALGLLISQYQGKPVLAAMIASYTNRLQEIENAIFQILTAFDLTNTTNPPVGDQLAKLAKIVGEIPGGKSDADLLNIVLARIVANNSNGHPDDMIQIAKIITGNQAIQYSEGYPLAWELLLPTVTFDVAMTILRLLGIAKTGGVRASVIVPDPTPFIFASTTGSVFGYAAFGDVTTLVGTAGNFSSAFGVIST